MPRGVLVLKKETPETHLEEQLGVSRHFIENNQQSQKMFL